MDKFKKIFKRKDPFGVRGGSIFGGKKMGVFSQKGAPGEGSAGGTPPIKCGGRRKIFLGPHLFGEGPWGDYFLPGAKGPGFKRGFFF